MSNVPLTTLGRSGLTVSRLGLAGSYGIDADAVERGFHELGVRYFFVTTQRSGFTDGVKRLIRAGHRDQMVLAGGANIPTGFSVRREAEKVLQMFETDHVDLFQLFWVQAHWYVTGKTWPAMREIKESGKAKALGMSIHDRIMARKLVDELDLDALMIRYNAARRGAEKEIFDSLDATTRPGIIAYTATRWGKLLTPIKDQAPMSAGECYRFPLTHPKVDVVLCGAKSYDELAQAAAGVIEGPIASDRLREIRSFGDVVRGTATGTIGFAGA